MTYDPLNRFYELVGTNPRRRVYDGDELIMEYHPNGAMSRRFVHGPGTDEPLVWYGGGGSVRRFLHADERGSIVSATDSAGTPVVTYRYDEYGALDDELFIHIDLAGLAALLKAAEAAIATGRGRLELGSGGIAVRTGTGSFATVTLTYSEPGGGGLALAA